MKAPKNKTPRLAVLLCLAATLPLQAEPLVYEPFDYTDGTINGVSIYGGGTGLTGFWEGSTTNIPFSMSNGTGHAHGGAGEPGLMFPGLSTSGSVTLTRKSAPGGATAHRQVAAAVLPSLTSDDTTIYFSVLVRTKYYSIGNENLAFMFGTNTAADPNAKPVTMAGGEAIGFALKGAGSSIDFQAIAVDGGVTSVSDVGGLATDTPTIFMMVGKIEWGATTDTISLYSVTDVSAPLPAAFATLSADLDQSQFNTITIAGQQVSSLDEIRLGTTLADVGLAGGAPPAAETFALTISPAISPDTGFDLTWESQTGKLYNLRTSTDLAGAIPTWTLVQGEIAATPPTNTANVDPIDPRRFYAVEEYDAPPPPPLFTSDFEADDGGFTVSTTAGSAWEWGTPASDNGQAAPNDLVLTTGNSGTSAWATNLGTANEGFYLNPTTTSLRSPVIDLTGATVASLHFAQAVDFAASDTAAVYVISGIDDSEIAGPIHTSSTGAILTADWAIANGGDPIALPPAALGQPVRLEWRFTGATNAFLGWYIDDVTVNAE